MWRYTSRNGDNQFLGVCRSIRKCKLQRYTVTCRGACVYIYIHIHLYQPILVCREKVHRFKPLAVDICAYVQTR